MRPHLPLEKPRRPFCDQKYRKVDGKRETRLFACAMGLFSRVGSPHRLVRVPRARQPARIDPRSSRIIAPFASLALIACRPSRSAACAMRLSVHSRLRCWPISAAREARGCVADLCESHARGCSIVRPSAAAGACGSRSTYRVRPVCGCLARAIRVFRPSTRCATPAGPATCAYSTFCMRVGCSFIVPVRMLRGI